LTAIKMTVQRESAKFGKDINGNSVSLSNGQTQDINTNGSAKTRKMEILWYNAGVMLAIHIAGFYGLYLLLTLQVKWQSILYASIVIYYAGLGVTAGAHRLWTHRSYKATLALRIFLASANTMSMQTNIYVWSRDHRVHHKYSETDADPHNAKRGFFFSHMGWLMVKKHPDVAEKGKTVDLSDITDDPVVMFQRRHYLKLILIYSIIIPTLIPMYFWSETFLASFFYCVFFRYVYILHGTWMVNSAAHLYGSRPYDKNINPSENRFVSTVAFGEGWHNYHHVFPWDYKTAELGNYSFNWTAAFIDFMAFLGQAYDLKTVSDKTIRARVLRTGDGSHPESKEGIATWGWGDPDMSKEEQNCRSA